MVNLPNYCHKDLTWQGHSMHRLSLKDITYPNRTRKTRRQQFLEQMEQIMSWALLLTFLCLHHPKGEQWRLLIPQEVMLRICFMQQ